MVIPNEETLTPGTKVICTSTMSGVLLKGQIYTISKNPSFHDDMIRIQEQDSDHFYKYRFDKI